MFGIALSNVLITLFYMIPGFVLRKAKKASESHLKTLSSILIYVCTPFLEISAFMDLDFTPSVAVGMAKFFAVTFVLQSAFMLILFLLLRKKYDDSRYRVLTIGSVLGNVGFFGLPIIRALLPESPEVAAYATTYMVSMNILIFTVGIFCLTNDKKYISLKSAVINPTVIGFAFAFPLYVIGARDFLPEVLVSAVKTLGGISTPLCMFVLGIRLASSDLKSILSHASVYAVCLLKLVVFPVFCFLAVLLLPVSPAFKTAVTVLSGTPCASAILALSEIHGGDSSMAANCILLSTIICFITIPLLTVLIQLVL